MRECSEDNWVGAAEIEPVLTARHTLHSWLGLLLAVGAVGLLTAPQLTFSINDARLGHAFRLVPGIEQITTPIALAALAAPFAFALWLWRAHRRHGDQLPSSRAWLLGGAATLLSLGLVVASFIINPRPFQGSFAMEARSRDGKYVVYMYLGGRPCGAHLYIAGVGERIAQHIESLSISCEAQRTARLVWKHWGPLVVDPSGAILRGDLVDLGIEPH